MKTRHWVWMTAMICASSQTFANDTLGIIKTQVIIVQKSDQISMLTEDLMISQKRIQVKYHFKNMSDHDITSEVIFPLPKLSWETPYSVKLDEKVGKKWIPTKDPLHFELTVDGQKKPVLLDTKRDEESHEYDLNYHWTQVFKAGKEITIEHTYVPGFGTGVDPNDAKLYCEDENFQKAAQKIEDEIKYAVMKKIESKPSETILKTLVSNYEHFHTFNRVQYILRTGSNWKGPIQHFKLTLKKENAADLISTCFAGLKKHSPTEFVFEAENFKPQEDLGVLFELHFDPSLP